MRQEAAPAGFVFLVTFCHIQHVPVAIVAHTERHQHRYVFDFTGPAALEYDAVQVDVGIDLSYSKTNLKLKIPREIDLLNLVSGVT